MPDLASPEWVAAVDDALRAVPRPEAPTSDVVVEYRITGPGDRTDVYHLSVSAAGYRATPGPAPEATAVVTVDRSVATRLVRGELDAHQEILLGTVVVDGDTVALVDAQSHLGTIQQCVASVPVPDVNGGG